MKRTVAHFGIFLALALIFGYVESLIPISIGIPGIKLGIANLVTVVVLYKLGEREAWLISVLRIILTGFLFGNMFAIFYSLAGGLLSLLIMSLLKKKESFSKIGVSIAGGVCHNLGQLIMAMLIVENLGLIYYAPVLLVAGIITGFIIGILADELLKRLSMI